MHFLSSFDKLSPAPFTPSSQTSFNFFFIYLFFLIDALWLDLHLEAFYSLLYMEHVKALISTYHQIEKKAYTQALNELLFRSTLQMKSRTDECTVSAMKKFYFMFSTKLGNIFYLTSVFTDTCNIIV